MTPSFKTKQKIETLKGQLTFHENMGNKGMAEITKLRLDKVLDKELARQKKAGKKFLSNGDIDLVIKQAIEDEAAN